jgi:hypothetical protein
VVGVAVGSLAAPAQAWLTSTNTNTRIAPRSLVGFCFMGCPPWFLPYIIIGLGNPFDLLPNCKLLRKSFCCLLSV